jgi:hypothetical protein
MSNKRGQVTIFVIIGILIVLIIGLGIYTATRVTEEKVIIPQLQGDAGPIQLYIEACLNEVGTQGLNELGMHGGYIYPTSPEYTGTRLIYDPYEPSESDGTQLDIKNLNSSIPYWYYFKSEQQCWHCQFNTNMPTLNSMEQQLNKYINKNLGLCLKNFSSFEDQGYIIKELNSVSADTKIAESTVNFMINYSIEITRNRELTKADLFYKEVNIPLKKYYTIARNITALQANTGFLDAFTLYLIGQYSGLDFKKLPPIGEYSSGYTTIFWSKTSTKMNFESLLISNIPLFRINGTSNNFNITRVPRTSVAGRMYAGMILHLMNIQEQKDLNLDTKEVNFIYLGQPTYMNINPSDGELVSPSVSGKNMGDLGSTTGGLMSGVKPDQYYNFFYDISYPVIVTIQDNTPGKEYVFVFAVQANLKQNKRMRDWIEGNGTIDWSRDYVKMNINDPSGGATLYDPISGENYTFTQSGPTKKFFCNSDQKLSGEIKLRTYDSITSQSLNEVTVTHNCGNYASCYLGISQYNSTFDESIFSDKMPLCAGGYLLLEKPDYLPKRIPLTTNYEENNNLGAVYLEPIFTKNVTLKKFMIQRDYKNIGPATVAVGYKMSNSFEELGKNDTVVLRLTRVINDVMDTPWSQTIIFGKDAMNNKTQLMLPAGRYDIDAQLMDYNGVVIPKECKAVCVDDSGWQIITGCTEYDYIPPEDIHIDVAMWGGISFKNTTQIFISENDLMSNKTLEFYIVRMPNPRCLDDMNEPQMTGYFANKYRNILSPKFV